MEKPGPKAQVADIPVNRRRLATRPPQAAHGVASPFDGDQFWMAFEPLIRDWTGTACYSIAPLAPDVVECLFRATNAFTGTDINLVTGETLPAYWVRHFWVKEGKIVGEERFDASVHPPLATLR